MKSAETTFYFVRHGEVDNPDNIVYGRVDVPLSQYGFAQMLQAGKNLYERGIKPDVIYSSPLTRALQSAREIGNAFLDVAIVTDERFIEGYMPGLAHYKIDWLNAIGGDIYDRPKLSHLVIERPTSYVRRYHDAIRSILREHPGGVIFAIVHGHPMAFTKYHLLNPGFPLPKVSELKSSGIYPEKGQPWKAVVDANSKLLEHDIIVFDEVRRGTKRE